MNLIGLWIVRVLLVGAAIVAAFIGRDNLAFTLGLLAGLSFFIDYDEISDNED